LSGCKTERSESRACQKPVDFTSSTLDARRQFGHDRQYAHGNDGKRIALLILGALVTLHAVARLYVVFAVRDFRPELTADSVMLTVGTIICFVAAWKLGTKSRQ